VSPRALAGIDLNLLVALDALLREHNVTRAGQQVGLSQPAMSHALSRLRDLLQDELLVRGPDGMRPTALGQELAPAVREVLDQIRRTLFDSGRFEPATDERTLTLAVSDYVGHVLVPALVARIRERAPHLQLRFRPLPPAVPVQALAEGELDLVIGTFGSVPPGVMREDLYAERFVCLLARQRAQPGPLTPESFAARHHVLVTSPGEGPGPVDDALGALGLRRHIAVYVPHFLVAPALVVRDDLVVTLPHRLAVEAAGQLPVELLEPPVPLETFPVSQLWHERTARHPAHLWLREQVRAAAS
jgi:DNA-binding transcriptional LysR family regulator